MGFMLFKKTTTYNAHPRVYNSTAYLHDTQLVMRNDEMYETCDIHNYYLLYMHCEEETWAGVQLTHSLNKFNIID